MPSDPFQMAMIHRTFRNEFGHISELVRAVTPRDTKRSGIVGSYCDNMISVLHHHRAAEEWQTFIDRGAAYVNPRNLWFALAYAGFLLRDGTPDEQRRFIEAVPLPLRVTLKLLGGRARSAYRTRLYGDGD